MKLTTENHKYIVQKYSSGCSATSIAKAIGVSTATVTKSLRKQGVIVNSKLKHTIHSFDTEIFSVIDNADKAYWLGFLMGDASIDARRMSLHVEISKIDKTHLEKLKSFMNGTQEIRDTKKNCCRIIFSSKKFVDSLQQYGLVRNKTYNVKTPNIHKMYLHDFYRGILDSDGWITKHGDQHEFGFSSANKEFLVEIKNWIVKNLRKECGYLTERIRPNKHRVCQLIIGGNNNFKAIADLIYHNPIYCLDRKFEKIKCFLEEI